MLPLCRARAMLFRVLRSSRVQTVDSSVATNHQRRLPVARPAATAREGFTETGKSHPRVLFSSSQNLKTF
ncbi:hypothetical protein BDA96_10G130700 [Sorghum bicolor]|uniref:Uncharacterized protein n=1 Tax=Sorghum bicolor TaxID=4558 RepID=A0A921Q3K0_SORBI|nr:hypothetical protein BDA96_10G130700 [Sorghum bicolor]